MADLTQNHSNVQNTNGATAGKKKKPLAIFFLAGALLLLVILAGLYWTGTLDRFIPGQGQEEPAPGPPRYTVPMKEFQVNLADTGARRFLRMRIYLAFDERALVKEVEERQPEIRSEIIAVLRSKTVADLDGPEGMDALQQVILEQLNGLLKGGQIHSLYFDEFIIQ